MAKVLNFCSILFITMLLFQYQPTISAQDNDLVDLTTQWDEIQQQFLQKNAMLQTDPSNSDLKLEVEAIVTKGRELIPRLKAEVLKQLQETPKDPGFLRQIMGILLYQASEGNDLEVLRTGDKLIQMGIHSAYFEVAARAERLSISGREIFEELLNRQRDASVDDLPRVRLNTNRGAIVLELFEDQAPNTVANFITLINKGHFNEVLFHRVIEGFMAQAGERQLDGSPTEEIGYTIACECLSPETRRHFTHSLSMAHAGPNTGGGQFFLTFRRTSHLDGQHTCFGRVIEGAEVLDLIVRTHGIDDQELPDIEKDRIQSAEVLRKRDHEYKVRKFGQPEPKSDPKIDEVPVIPPIDPNSTESGGLPKLPDRD